MRSIATTVCFEQAVYGNFPFWNRGYGILARSAGCQPEWLVTLRTACQRLGERPTGIAETPALFALRIDRGPWMIVSVAPLGDDDAGRPGALAFHALFVSHWTYVRAGASPFAFVERFRREWGPDNLDRILPSGRATIQRAGYRASPDPGWPTGVENGPAIVQAIARGRSVIVQQAGPIDALARAVWRALPLHVRLRASVATWAFDNANRFDLIGVPKLAGLAREETDLVLVTGDASSPILATASPPRHHLTADVPGNEPRFSS